MADIDAEMFSGDKNLELWTRDGFQGVVTALIRPHLTEDFVHVEGVHAPRLIDITTLPCPDSVDPSAFPVPIATGRTGLILSVTGRREAMPYTFRNVENDEVHFLQQGSAEFETDYGVLKAGPGDFVFIPRSVAYRVAPVGGAILGVILESPGRLKINPNIPETQLDVPKSIEYPKVSASKPREGRFELVLKSFDGVTRFIKPLDPLAATAMVAGQVPVWKVNLDSIVPAPPYPDRPSPPIHFAESPNFDVVLFTISSRAVPRAPIHHNADYDEITLYMKGAPWGGITKPGTLGWVPKGVTHHGPPEDIAEGYTAWLMECRDTLRLTPEGQQYAHVMETGQYGLHDASRRSAYENG